MKLKDLTPRASPQKLKRVKHPIDILAGFVTEKLTGPTVKEIECNTQAVVTVMADHPLDSAAALRHNLTPKWA